MIRLLLISLKTLLVIVLLTAVGVIAFLWLAPVLGGSPDQKSTAVIEDSPNFDGRKFVNTIATTVSTPDSDEPMDIWGMISPRPGKNPSSPLPSRSFDKTTFGNGDLVWFGHSTVLMKTTDVTVMIDPVFLNASPIPFTIQPFPTQHNHTIEHLPEIDVVVISHDHYDHLDYRAIVEMDAKVERYLVPLGVKAHLQRWGVADKKIREMDWHKSERWTGTTVPRIKPSVLP